MTTSRTQSPSWESRALRDIVERALELPNALGSEIRHVSRHCSPYESTHPLRVVRVEFDSGASLELLLKDLAPARTLHSARGVKPARLVNPRREIYAYETVLRDRSLGTPALHTSMADAATSRYWILVEHVDGPPLWQVGEFEIWEGAARWLARMHDTTQDFATNAAAVLVAHDEEELRRWPPLALQTVRSSTGALRHVSRRYDTVVELLTARPASFLHGEFYASNILSADGGRRICAVDWEMAGIGAAELDVAALAAGWNEPERAMLINAYRDACAHPAAAPVFERTVEAARLHNALRWLGWSSGWTPPVEHRTDWVREATDAAERLGL